MTPTADKVRQQRDAALARCEALEKLLACYRVGKSPSEKLHRELARTQTRLAEVMDGFAPGVAPNDSLRADQ
jgi:hypothetical protein